MNAMRKMYDDALDDELLDDIFELIDMNSNELVTRDEWLEFQQFMEANIKNKLLIYMHTSRKKSEDRMIRAFTDVIQNALRMTSNGEDVAQLPNLSPRPLTP